MMKFDTGYFYPHVFIWGGEWGGGLGFILAVFRGAVVGFIFNNICFYGKILYISLCYLPKISLK